MSLKQPGCRLLKDICIIHPAKQSVQRKNQLTLGGK